MRIWLLVISLFTQVAFAEIDTQKVAAIVQKYVEKEKFSGNLLVSKSSEVEFHKAYGLASRNFLVPNSTTSKFIIGSVSKQFTAAAVMKLVQDGKLDVHSKINKIIPNSPEHWEGISVHHLLTHGSGLKRDPTDVPGFNTGNGDYAEQLKYHPLEKLIEFLKLSKPESAPGVNFKYSNLGYTILAYVVQVVSGKDFIEYLENEIFKANGLKNTGIYHPTNIISGLSDGYWLVNGDHVAQACCYEPLNILGAASVYSTTEDLLLWDQILASNRFFNSEISKSMFTAWNKSYGYGWVIEKILGEDVIWHNGSQNGYSSALYRFKNGLTIIILSNMYKVSVDKMVDEILLSTK